MSREKIQVRIKLEAPYQLRRGAYPGLVHGNVIRLRYTDLVTRLNLRPERICAMKFLFRILRRLVGYLLGVLLVGHVGKLVKVAGGIMNTHSHTADCRTELFCTHAALCGADRKVCTALYNAATTDACLEILDTAGLRKPVLQSLLAAIQLHLDRRAGGAFRVGAVLFSNQHGPLGETKTAKELMQEWQN